MYDFDTLEKCFQFEDFDSIMGNILNNVFFQSDFIKFESMKK